MRKDYLLDKIKQEIKQVIDALRRSIRDLRESLELILLIIKPRGTNDV